MSTNYHTALVDGNPGNLNGNAATLNVPLGELDAQIKINADDIAGMLAGTEAFDDILGDAQLIIKPSAATGTVILDYHVDVQDNTSDALVRLFRVQIQLVTGVLIFTSGIIHRRLHIVFQLMEQHI